MADERPLAPLGEYTVKVVGMYTDTKEFAKQDFNTKQPILDENGNQIMEEKTTHKFKLEIVDKPEYKAFNFNVKLPNFVSFFRPIPDPNGGKTTFEFTLTNAGKFLEVLFGNVPKKKIPASLLDWESVQTCYFDVTGKPDTFKLDGEDVAYFNILDFKQTKDGSKLAHNLDRKNLVFARMGELDKKPVEDTVAVPF